MSTATTLRTIAFSLLSGSIGAAAVVMTPLHAQTGTASALTAPTVRPITALAPVSGSNVAVDPLIPSLQAQIANLQAQLNALATAIRVTPTGLVLQAPSVTILAGGITVQSQGNLDLRVNNLSLNAMSNATLRAGATAAIVASSSMGLRGQTIRLNEGTQPLAMVGGTVLNGRIVNGSPTVFAD